MTSSILEEIVVSDVLSYSRAYDNLMPLFSCYKALMKKTADKLYSRKKILDIGVGTGNLISNLMRSTISKELYGIDSSPAVMRYTKEKFKDKPEIFLFCQNADKTNFHDNFFDGIACINMLCYTNKPSEIIAEVRRILRPGGLFILSDPKPNINFDLLEKEFYKNIQGSFNLLKNDIKILNTSNQKLFSHLKKTFKDEELKELLKEFSFRISYSDNQTYLGQNHFIVAEK